MVKRIHKAANWNTPKDGYSDQFYKINTSNIWLSDEIDVSEDISVWETLDKPVKSTYSKALSGLTLLDTKQSTVGLPLLVLHYMKDPIRSATLNVSSFMESEHAKSYSKIFMTICSSVEIEEIFKWIESNKHLQYKAERITALYEGLFKPEVTKKELYKALVGSVYLESFLFYSGFFYPLYLAGQGLMKASGEIINLIIRDESVHGQFIGMLAQELYEEFNEEEKLEMNSFSKELMEDLMENEIKYTKDVYSEIGLTGEVNDFLKYNANKANDNLGLDHLYEDVEINPVVEAGLNTSVKNHDFFSAKGNGYKKAVNVTPLTDDDFDFDQLKESILP
ncbi:ribonucleotide-diphosphate reductase [Bacillus phage vB_BpuM-BpSp]|nr:ribonucleotide-diphosphate reductase [Bacillus phage vB_BpuM-BpSp]